MRPCDLTLTCFEGEALANPQARRMTHRGEADYGRHVSANVIT